MAYAFKRPAPWLKPNVAYACSAMAAIKLCAFPVSSSSRGMRRFYAKRAPSDYRAGSQGPAVALLASLDPLEVTFPDVDEDLAPVDDVEL